MGVKKLKTQAKRNLDFFFTQIAPAIALLLLLIGFGVPMHKMASESFGSSDIHEEEQAKIANANNKRVNQILQETQLRDSIERQKVEIENEKSYTRVKPSDLVQSPDQIPDRLPADKRFDVVRKDVLGSSQHPNLNYHLDAAINSSLRQDQLAQSYHRAALKAYIQYVQQRAQSQGYYLTITPNGIITGAHRLSRSPESVIQSQNLSIPTGANSIH